MPHDNSPSPTAAARSGPARSGPKWPKVPQRPDLAAMEREILERWAADEVFRRSITQRADAPVWTFYEGPPTANGRPGTHHVEARAFKDIFPRYRTMKGYSVRRKAGWDCHGLPVELEVERELGLNSKSDIEEYGIEAFNARCRESVQRYVGAFEDLTDRIGFWIDTDDAYRTMDPEYIDSLWWALKQLWDRELIFEDHRVAPYCGRCGTGLSDAEVSLGYEDVDDPSVYVRFPVLDGPLAAYEAALVVWTTTPWTVPSNTACAVGADVRYSLVRTDAFVGTCEHLVLATDLLDAVVGDGRYEVLEEYTGEQLVGTRYRAPYDLVEVSGPYRYVTTAEFVTTTDGTGIVHMAPAFGADDMLIARREGLPVVNPVDAEGRFSVGPWTGQFVKDADAAIIEDIDARGLLLASETYRHSYPHCWRCKRPLIYWAKPSWYIRTTDVRDRLLANNAKIDWHPEHIRDGRFGNWLENNVDWALSRDRYWGTPLPFWRCGDCSAIEVVGSRAELSERSGEDHSNLDPHRPYVDEVTLACRACGGVARRIADVADAWFDSGGMPYAQWGYPHTGREEFARHYPADYICEAIDQTRGWFYTLLAESTLLFDDASYRTCLCLGHIVDENGRKMSKSVGNVLDPFDLVEEHGADALRWLMFADGNPWVSRRVSHQLVEDVVRRFLLTVWNTHVFFTTYAAIDEFDPTVEPPAVQDRPAVDRWILAELAHLVRVVDTSLDAYDVTTSTRALERFVDDLSNWYVRRSRRRFWKAATEDPHGKAAAYHTLHTCLTTLARLIAPFTPFIAERLWQDLVIAPGLETLPSVHLTEFPVVDPAFENEALRTAMATARRIVELGRQARNDSGVRVRQPLARALVSTPASERPALEEQGLLDDIAEELNVHEIEISNGTGQLVQRSLKPQFRALGPRFQSEAPKVAATVTALDADAADAVAEQLRHGEATIDVGGSPVTLSAEMVEVVETPLTGWAVAKEGGTSFALDTELTRELLVEGAARELVRAVNDLRKAEGLDLADRVRLELDVTPAQLESDLVAGGHLQTIAREVLATDVERRDDVEGIHVDFGELGSAVIAVRR